MRELSITYAFMEGMRDLGYVECENVHMNCAPPSSDHMMRRRLAKGSSLAPAAAKCWRGQAYAYA